MSTNLPRTHADVIKAWADGAEIEFRFRPGDHWQSSLACGLLFPTDGREYRIKPAKTTHYLNYYGDWYFPSVWTTLEEANLGARGRSADRLACFKVTKVGSEITAVELA